MSGIAHHLVKRSIDAGRESYRSGAFARDGEDNKPFGHPHAVAIALVLTSIVWFIAMSAVSIPLLASSADDSDYMNARCNTYMAESWQLSP